MPTPLPPLNIETRAAFELRAVPASGSSPPRLEGIAAPYGKWSEDLGGFRERLTAGVFSRSLRSGRDVPLLIGHDGGQPVARLSAGTLTLREIDAGLAFTATLQDTQAARDLHTDVRTGNFTGMSFSFRAARPNGDHWSFPSDALAERELIDADLFELSVVALPAYPDTAVAARSLAFAKLEADRPSRNARAALWHEYFRKSAGGRS